MSEDETITGLRRGGAFAVAAFLGFVALALGVVTLAMALGSIPWAVLPGVLAAAAGYATWRVFSSKSARHTTSRSEVELARLQQTIAALPPGTRVRRSTAGKTSTAVVAARVVYVAGLILAGLMVLTGAAESETWTLLVVGLAGGLAGVLLGIARDGRGRRASLLTALSLPGVLGVWMVGAGLESAQGADDIGGLLFGALGVVLVTGLPVLIGFFVVRVLMRFYEATRGADANPLAPGMSLTPELNAAIDRGRAAAVLREYEADPDGMQMFSDDREQLERIGYRLVHTAEHAKRSSDFDVQVLSALFIRHDAASALHD